jgi:hypothetical protein
VSLVRLYSITSISVPSDFICIKTVFSLPPSLQLLWDFLHFTNTSSPIVSFMHDTLCLLHISNSMCSAENTSIGQETILCHVESTMCTEDSDDGPLCLHIPASGYQPSWVIRQSQVSLPWLILLDLEVHKVSRLVY